MLLLLGMLLASAASADPPPIRADDVTAEATSAAGASVTYHVRAYDSSTPSSPIPIAATCNPPGSGGAGDFDVTADFPVGDTSVTCTTTEPEYSLTFTVHVVDTTPPSLPQPPDVTASTTDPAGTAVSWDTITATDIVDGSIIASCVPASGSVFVIGTSTVTCSATDSHGKSAQTQFAVTVTLDDTQAPTLNVPGDQTAEATGPSGAAVTYSVTATDDTDPSPSINCDHASGSTFPIATTTVTCTATDASGKSSPPASFMVVVADTTAPALSLPGDQTIEVSEPGGATFTYSASATDIVDGAVAVACIPPGFAFPMDQTTTVNCTATDSHGRTASGSFTVTVSLVDNTAPTFAGVPATTQREANGPLGSVATYTPPTATDNLDGPLVVNCLPPSGSTFPLGTTNVSCTATDSHGNVGTTSFAVVVVDTTKPVLTPPSDRNIYATTPNGIPKDDPGVMAFLSGGTATDIVDKTLSIGNNAPAFLPVGTTIVTFTTADDSGNTDQGTAALTIFPTPPAGTTPAPLPQPPARTPPEDVKNVKAIAGSRKVTLSWTKPSAANFDHVTITRSLADGAESALVYTGAGTSYVDTSVQNGIEYRYTIVSFDDRGDRSAGVVVAARPRQLLLLTPKDGARIKSTKKSLKLSWARVKGANYYNAQLFFVPDLKALGLDPAKAQAEVKVRSVWPKKNTFVLKKTWKFAGVRYRLRPGLYRWYIWPGYGARAAVNYGPLMGSSTFIVVP